MELPMRKTLTIFVLNLFLLSGATALLGACNPQLAWAKTFLPPGMRLPVVPTKAGRVNRIRSVESLTRNPGRGCVIQLLLVVSLILVVLSFFGGYPASCRPILAMGWRGRTHTADHFGRVAVSLNWCRLGSSRSGLATSNVIMSVRDISGLLPSRVRSCRCHRNRGSSESAAPDLALQLRFDARFPRSVPRRRG